MQHLLAVWLNPIQPQTVFVTCAESIPGKELHIPGVSGTGLAFIRSELATFHCVDVYLPTFTGPMVTQMFQDGLQQMNVKKSSVSKILASRPIRVLVAETGGAPGLLIELIITIGREYHASNQALTMCALQLPCTLCKLIEYPEYQANLPSLCLPVNLASLAHLAAAIRYPRLGCNRGARPRTQAIAI